MLDIVVRYLKSGGVGFRLFTYPSPELTPVAAHPVPKDGVLVDTHVILVGGRPAVACIPAGEKVNLSRLAAELSLPVEETGPSSLPSQFQSVVQPVPATGGAVGVATLVDEEITRHAIIVFRAFSPDDYIEMLYDDFAVIEKPRVSSFSYAGEIPSSGKSAA